MVSDPQGWVSLALALCRMNLYTAVNWMAGGIHEQHE
jgi:hypothetical protein